MLSHLPYINSWHDSIVCDKS